MKSKTKQKALLKIFSHHKTEAIYKNANNKLTVPNKVYTIITIVRICQIPISLSAKQPSMGNLNRKCSWHVLAISVLFVLNTFMKNLFTTKSNELTSDLFSRQASSSYISPCNDVDKKVTKIKEKNFNTHIYYA